MCLLGIFIFLLYSGCLVQSDESDCERDFSTLASHRLKTHLLCAYDQKLRPTTSHTLNTTVTFRLILKYFDYDITRSVLSIDSWISIYWVDEHLKWVPADYEDIEEIHLSTDDIWTPDLSVYNMFDQSTNPRVLQSANCIISFSGLVFCVPSHHADALCVADVSRYPYDEQNCTVTFGSWVHKGEELHLKIGNPAVDTEDLVQNGEWHLEKINAFKNPGKYACCPNNTYPSINISLKMKRLSGSYTASVIIPALVGVILTLTSLWVSPDKTDRMTICCVNVLAQFLHMQYVSWMIPLKGDRVPQLIVIARDSLLLSCLTILFTVILRHICEKKEPAPQWVSSIVSFVIGCKPGQILLLSDNSPKGIASAKGEEDGTTIIDNSESNFNSSNSQDWLVFAKIFDRLIFISFVIVFFFMFIAYLP